MLRILFSMLPKVFSMTRMIPVMPKTAGTKSKGIFSLLFVSGVRRLLCRLFYRILP
jgi:hypothetical protein